VTILWAALAQ